MGLDGTVFVSYDGKPRKPVRPPAILTNNIDCQLTKVPEKVPEYTYIGINILGKC